MYMSATVSELGGEETHSLGGEGVGGLNSDEGIETPVLYVCYNPSTL